MLAKSTAGKSLVGKKTLNPLLDTSSADDDAQKWGGHAPPRSPRSPREVDPSMYSEDVAVDLLAKLWARANVDTAGDGLHREDMRALFLQLHSGSDLVSENAEDLIEQSLKQLGVADDGGPVGIVSFTQFKLWYLGPQTHVTQQQLQQYGLRPWSTIVPEFLTLSTTHTEDLGQQEWLTGMSPRKRDKDQLMTGTPGYANWAKSHDRIDRPKASTLDIHNSVLRGHLKHSLVIDPDGQFRQTWDILQVFLLVYLAMMTPYDIAFDAPDPTLWSLSFWLTAAMDAYFFIDLYCAFVTAKYGADAELVIDKRVLAMSYLRG
jgi:hypothetical protein